MKIEHICDVNLEDAFISSVLMWPDSIDDFDPPVQAQDFYNIKNAIFWAAIMRLHSKGMAVTPFTVKGALTPDERQTLGAKASKEAKQSDDWLDYLMREIANDPGASVIGLVENATRIKALAHRRRWLEVLGKIAPLVYDESQEVDAVDAEALRMINEVLAASSADDDGLISFTDAVSQYFDEVSFMREHDTDTAINIIDLPTLNQWWRLKPGHFGIVAARTGEGKSSFLLQVAEGISRKHRVLYSSQEMNEKENIMRTLAQHTGMSTYQQEHMTDADFVAFTKWMNTVTSNPRQFYFDCAFRQTPQRIARIARRIQRRGGLDAIFIDYIQIMSGDTRTNGRVEELEYITRSLKGLAMELKVPVIAAAQLNRGAVYNQRAPDLKDLRGSGSLEQDTDSVFFLWDPNKSDNEDNRPRFEDKTPRPVKGILAKNRNGSLGEIDMLFFKDKVKFAEMTKERNDEKRLLEIA